MLSELMLIENPSKRERGPSFISPYDYYRMGRKVQVSGHIRKSKGGKNPMNGIGAISKQWLGGLNLMDMGAALGGLAASTMIPSMIVKDTSTTGGKVMKTVAAFGSAALAGFVFKNVSPSAAKYAIAGGVAGALAQTLAMFTNVKIGESRGVNYINSPIIRRNLGESRLETPSESESIQVSVT